MQIEDKDKLLTRYTQKPKPIPTSHKAIRSADCRKNSEYRRKQQQLAEAV